METRKEKFRKYREEIKLTPDSAFSSSEQTQWYSTKEDKDVLKNVESSSKAISYGSILAPLETAKEQVEDSKTPYERYVSRKRRIFIVKIASFLVVVAALVVWFVLIQRGR
ncbi:MAG: hypothetical protein MJ239_00830 [Bacilli bacterium]|nr:hypothetical protein [Bacilli bacterium]